MTPSVGLLSSQGFDAGILIGKTEHLRRSMHSPVKRIIPRLANTVQVPYSRTKEGMHQHRNSSLPMTSAGDTTELRTLETDTRDDVNLRPIEDNQMGWRTVKRTSLDNPPEVAADIHMRFPPQAYLQGTLAIIATRLFGGPRQSS